MPEQRPALAACPCCGNDHTSWSGCWLAELGGVLQNRGWSTEEIAEAIQKIPSVQAIYDRYIGPAVDVVEEYLPSAEELEEQERQARREAEAEGPTERQIEAMMNYAPEPPMHYLDKDTLGRGGLR